MVFFYRREGETFMPSALAISPWEPDKQNGVGLGGLLAHLVDTVEAPCDMAPARLIIDILSAAPFGPLLGRSRIVREGRRIQHVEAELLANERVVARATALRVRTVATPAALAANPYPPPEDVPPAPFMDQRAFGGTLQTRIVRGGRRESGPGTLWARFDHEHVEGVKLTPLVRTAIFGDFGSGVGSVLPVRDWNFPNLDISVHLTRLPEGEWLLMDALTTSSGNGMALSSAIMADRLGPFARSHQTLFVSPRG